MVVQVQNDIIISITNVIYKASRNRKKRDIAATNSYHRGQNFPFLYYHKSWSLIDAYFITALLPYVIWSFRAYPQGPQFLIEIIKNSFYAPLHTAKAQIEISIFYNEIPVAVTNRHDSWRERPVYPVILHVFSSLWFIKMCTVSSWMERRWVFAQWLSFE